ncbi:MAG: NADH:flavin oxidoreductase [Armatimonadota bacterium]
MSNILFEKVKVGNLTLKNRIFMSAAAAYAADTEGDIESDKPLLHYRAAKGGCALVPTGGTGGTHPSGRMSANRPMFNSDERIPSFKKFADKVHEGGSAAVLQVTHSGASAAPYQLSIGKKPFTVSYYFKNPKSGFAEENRIYLPAEKEEILDVISAYGDAAERAKKAGFDGIQVHAAHESLLSQWLSPVYNKRNDAWGGSLESRCRIHREILKDMKKKAGKDFPVIIKLGIEDCRPEGLKAEDGIKAAELIANDGNADIIEVSQGLQDITDMSKTSMRPNITSIEKEAYYRTWTKEVKKAVGDKVFVTIQGGMRTPSLMEEVIKNGEADFVSMCRPYIREPEVVNRWLSGDKSKATCISCNQCIINHVMHGKPLECVFNTK